MPDLGRIRSVSMSCVEWQHIQQGHRWLSTGLSVDHHGGSPGGKVPGARCSSGRRELCVIRVSEKLRAFRGVGGFGLQRAQPVQRPCVFRCHRTFQNCRKSCVGTAGTFGSSLTMDISVAQLLVCVLSVFLWMFYPLSFCESSLPIPLPPTAVVVLMLALWCLVAL